VEWAPLARLARGRRFEGGAAHVSMRAPG
jgi:hypothetical protein